MPILGVIASLGNICTFLWAFIPRKIISRNRDVKIVLRWLMNSRNFSACKSVEIRI